MGRKNRKAAKYGSPRERKLAGIRGMGDYVPRPTPDLTEEAIERLVGKEGRFVSGGYVCESTGATTWLTTGDVTLTLFDDVSVVPRALKVAIPEGLTEDEWHIGEAYARVKKDGRALMAQLMEESYTTEICAYIRAMGWEIPARLLPMSAKLLQERDQEQADSEDGQDPEEMQLW